MHIPSRAQNRTGSELSLIENEELGMKTDNPMQSKSYAFPLWIVGWSATQKLIRYGGDCSGKMSLKEGGGFCHEKEA